MLVHTAAAAMVAVSILASPVQASQQAGQFVLAQLVTGTPQQKLQKLLRPHAYYGGHVTDDIRAATGDPNIPVIDRRHRWGEIYTCSYMFMRGAGQGRTLVCE